VKLEVKAEMTAPDSVPPPAQTCPAPPSPRPTPFRGRCLPPSPSLLPLNNYQQRPYTTASAFKGTLVDVGLDAEGNIVITVRRRHGAEGVARGMQRLKGRECVIKILVERRGIPRHY
jgi:hypothetical protein